MRSLNIDFLLRLTDEPQVVSGSEIELLVKNVMAVLRENRGKGHLNDNEVMVSNRFILAMSFLFLNCESVELDITPHDLDYIFEENEYMRMGVGRN